MWELVNKSLNIVFSLCVLGFDGGLRNSPSAGQRHEESRHIHLHLITPLSDHLLSSRDLPNLSRTPHHLAIISPAKDCLQEHQHYKNRLEAFVPKERLLKDNWRSFLFKLFIYSCYAVKKHGDHTIVHFCSTIEWPPQTQIFHTSSCTGAHAPIKRITVDGL